MEREAAMIDDEREARGRSSVGSERRTVHPKTTVGARLEIAATRTRMSGTIAELEQRMSATVDGVKQKVDVATLVRQHPWPALAMAFVAGVALSASGADRSAARATTRAAKRAPDTAKRGASSAAHATAAGVSQLASKAVERVRGRSEDHSNVGDQQQSGGLLAKATGALKAQVRELGVEVSRGVEELTPSAQPRQSATS
jgi:ElaB/YqjD/DUF883 family membrane-anchored ribosome-binding protein